MKPKFYLAVSLACLLAGASFAANSSFTSTANVTVDTRDGVPTFSYRRLDASVVANGGADAGVDDALIVRGTNKAALLALLTLGMELINQEGISGVIADGVTPMLIVVSAPANLTTTRSYKITPKVADAVYAGGPNLSDSIQDKVLVLANDAFSPSDQITLSPSAPQAFVLVNPLNPDKINHNPPTGSGYGLGYKSLKVSLAFSELGLNRVAATAKFQVRKPPVVLVHGFDSDSNTWDKSTFLPVLKAERGDDFVIPLNYGTENGKKANTFDKLEVLLGTLDSALRNTAENKVCAWPQDAYAWTRYDVVGHSQGGVLLRFLCSSFAAGGSSLESKGFNFPQFSSEKNFHRGRFRRVVTIGSPHAGSTIAQLAIRMREKHVPFRFNDPIELFAQLDRRLQPKFMIDIPSAGSNRPNTVRGINALLTPDPGAKIHMLGATIFGGKPPAASFGVPLIYASLWLDTTDIQDGKTRGSWIAPFGSDGVVDLRSQWMTIGTSAPQNGSAMLASTNIAHSSSFVSFGTDATETNDTGVAWEVVSLLDFNGTEFGPMPNTNPAIDAEMNATVSAIENIVDSIAASLEKPEDKGYISTPATMGSLSTSSRRLSSFSSSGGAIAPMSASAPALEFDLASNALATINGNATWTALIYGPAGITSDGLTLTTSGTNASHVSLLIDDAVVGQVTLQATYPSTSGKTVIGKEAVVATRNTGTLTGIELRPDTLALEPGTEVPLEVWGVFDTGNPCRLFIASGDIAYESSDTNVATVDADGRVSLLAEGSVTITATYQGNQTASTQVTVLGPAPQITSAASVNAIVGVTVNYQITASGSPTGFRADNLPPNLSLNATTGLISGTPATNGLFSVQIGATNATGTGWKTVSFIVDPGSNQPPSNIGLSATAVPANQPTGTIVGTLSASDPNPADTTFTYTLVAGTGADDNGLFAISGGNLAATTAINPATKPLCKIRVRCTDSGGLFIEKAFELPVLGAPVITSQPTDARGLSGSSLTLSVQADGVAPLSYQWHQNGVDVPGATGSFVSISAGASTTGNWTVTVTNVYGSVTSNAAVVTADNSSFSLWANQNASWLGTKTGAMDDADGNGIPNLLKFALAGSNYQNAPSRTILPELVSEGNQLVFRYLKARDKVFTTFRVMRSQNLTSWQEFVPANGTMTVQPASTPYLDSDIIRITIPAPSPRAFFRLEVAE